jgi:rhodanese-related sulfurtransferase
MELIMSFVSETSAAASDVALTHFELVMQFETDCWDVHHALTNHAQDFVLLDVRSPNQFNEGHIPGALNLPHGKIVATKLSDYPMDTLFVVYCAGPHCNGAARAAIRFARLGRPVKTMPGGITGWFDEGFELIKSANKTA